MSRIVVAGIGTPGFLPADRHFGPGRRSAHFAVALADAGHDVTVLWRRDDATAIAPAASAGLARLSSGDLQGFHGIMEPTVPLSRHIFKAPTRFYKTGVVFLAWLNGLQDHFIMVGGQESARSILHFAELFRLADKARVLHDPDLAAARMTKLLAVQGMA